MPSDNNKKIDFMILPMNTTELSRMPVHHNPMFGMQGLLRVKTKDLKITYNNKLIYENIKELLPNLSYSKVHLHFQKDKLDPIIKKQMDSFFKSATDFEAKSVEKAKIEEKMANKLKQKFK